MSAYMNAVKNLDELVRLLNDNNGGMAFTDTEARGVESLARVTQIQALLAIAEAVNNTTEDVTR